MKKLLLAVICLILPLALSAQDEMGGLGIHVGYASPTLRLNSPSAGAPTTLETTMMSGAQIGLSYDATIAKGFGTVIGLNYTYGTYHSKWEAVSDFSTDKKCYRDNYQGLDLFVDWQYKFEIAGDTYLILYTGPSIGVALALREQEYIRSADGTQYKQTRYGYEYRDNEAFEDYKRVNVTWGIGAGFQFKQFFLRGGYDFGLFNPYKHDTFKAMGVTDSDRYTRGRFDHWQIKIGLYLWQF